MPALGTLIEKRRGESLERFEYYLGLTDVLSHQKAAHLKALGESFGHSFVNLATLAGRLLWLEGVTPDIWRSHDILAVCADAQAYIVALQVACDTMADVIATIGGRPGQTPSESFHGLLEWAKRNPNRLRADFRFISERQPWFDQINGVRTKLVHRGGHVWIYTERVFFEWDVYFPGGRVSRGKYLLQDLKQLTKSTIEFSERLARIIDSENKLGRSSKKTLISGVYVPAIDNLLKKYELPILSEALHLNAKCLSACGGYVEACHLGYPDGFWWVLLMQICKLFDGNPVAAEIPVNTSGRVHDSKFALSHRGKSYGFLVCEHVKSNHEWLDGAAVSAAKFLDSRALSRVALVARSADGKPSEFLPDDRTPLIVDDEPMRAAQRIKDRLLA
jgi:hypothetical protein